MESVKVPGTRYTVKFITEGDAPKFELYLGDDLEATVDAREKSEVSIRNGLESILKHISGPIPDTVRKEMQDRFVNSFKKIELSESGKVSRETAEKHLKVEEAVDVIKNFEKDAKQRMQKIEEDVKTLGTKVSEINVKDIFDRMHNLEQKIEEDVKTLGTKVSEINVKDIFDRMHNLEQKMQGEIVAVGEKTKQLGEDMQKAILQETTKKVDAVSQHVKDLNVGEMKEQIKKIKTTVIPGALEKVEKDIHALKAKIPKREEKEEE